MMDRFKVEVKETSYYEEPTIKILGPNGEVLAYIYHSQLTFLECSTFSLEQALIVANLFVDTLNGKAK